MKKLFIHIGLPKTGSSSLQRFLKLNQGNLIEKGFLYPTAGLLDSVKGVAQHHLSFSLLNSYPVWARGNILSRDDAYGKLMDEIKDSHFSTLILSSEAFSSITSQEPTRWLKSKFKDFETKIVVYVRRPDLWLESWYAQVIKNHPFTSTSPEDFTRNAHISNLDAINLFADVFGDSNILLRPYEKEQLMNGDVVTDFLHIIGCDADLVFPKSSENVSPSADVVIFLRDLNSKINIQSKERRVLYESIIEFMSNSASDDKSTTLLSLSQRKKILESHREEIAFLAKRFLGRKDGELFHNVESLD